MTQNLIYRIGDADDYHVLPVEGEEPQLERFLNALLDAGVRGPLRYYRPAGVVQTTDRCPGLAGEGYEGKNYISVFYGPDIETPVDGLEPATLETINRRLLFPPDNIHWRDVRATDHIQETKMVFICHRKGQRPAVVNWSGHDAAQAQEYLKRRAKR